MRVFDLNAWRQRHRDHQPVRVSNARHRCADCGVESYAGSIICKPCRKRRTRLNQSGVANAQGT